MGCAPNQNPKIDLVKRFYSARNESDFGKLKMVVSDTLIEIEGTDSMFYSTNDYYKKFQWDSVFIPKYEMQNLEPIDNYILATISTTSKRFEYLDNNPMISKHKILFKNDKIFQIETFDYIGVDWDVWQMKRESLIKWIDNNHPELAGFIFDMTKQGGENYLKAIELFEDR